MVKAIFLLAFLVSVCLGNINLQTQLRAKLAKVASEKQSTRDVQVELQTFTQLLDHFNELDTRTWEQYYAVNDQFWNGTGPVFFFTSGFELDTFMVTLGSYQYVSWAQEFGALVVGLETRYWGNSIPVPDYSLENLQWNAEEQILADAANFRAFITEQYGLQDSKFIAIGNTQGGLISGWLRIKFPHLFYAAYSSSAYALQVQNGYPEYFAIAAEKLADPTLGGSPLCVATIANVTKEIEAISTTSEGLAFLSGYFNTCSSMVPEDIPNFMSYLAGHISAAVSYNNIEPNLYGFYPNISDVCWNITNPNNDTVSNYRNAFVSLSLGYCALVSQAQWIIDLTNTSIEAAVLYGRPQVYQYCTEFGQDLILSDSVNQPWGTWYNESVVAQNCQDYFPPGIPPLNAAWTNTKYGGNHPGASRTLWVNGDADPLAGLGVLQRTPGAGYKTLLIHGVSESADMYVPTPDSPQELIVAQGIIRQQLEEWINDDC